MCDYSLHHVKSRPAKVGDKLTTINFNTGTRGFAAPEDSTTAVRIAPFLPRRIRRPPRIRPPNLAQTSLVGTAFRRSRRFAVKERHRRLRMRDHSACLRADRAPAARPDGALRFAAWRNALRLLALRATG
jgi:hypothetical protein